MALQGDPKKWDQWPEIRPRCNPLTAVSETFRKKLLAERDAGRKDSRLRARFCSYRLNVPTQDSASMLLTVENFKMMCSRAVPPRLGRPIVGLDMGSGRAWSAACCVFRSGRIEALAVCPGIPSVQDQEKRDLQPAGSYQRLVDAGVLTPAPGVRVPSAKALVDAIKAKWGRPLFIVCDRFRLADVEDTEPGCRIVPRVSRWSEAASDIRALRSGAADGGLAVAEDSRDLLAASLSVAQVRNDDQGNTRIVKRGSNNCARDDVAVALTLAAGAAESTFKRLPARPIRFFVAS